MLPLPPVRGLLEHEEHGSGHPEVVVHGPEEEEERRKNGILEVDLVGWLECGRRPSVEVM